MSSRLVVACLTSFLLAAPSALAESRASVLGESGALLAQKKNKKKKKKKAEDEGESFGAEGVEAIEDSDQGVGIHRDQEGVDTPYIAEVGGSTDISLLSTEVKDSEAEPQDTTSVAINGQLLVILGKVGLGPDIGIEYDKTSTTVTTTTTDATGKPVTSSETANVTDLTYALGPTLKIFFGNVDKSLTLPFAYVGLQYRGATSEAGNDKTEASGFGVKIGGGLNLFVDSNVAFTPSAEFRYVTMTTKGDEKKGTKDVEAVTSGFRVLFGITTFI